MLIDVYAIQPEIKKEYDPLFLSFDHEFVFNPKALSCREYIPLDVIQMLAESFVPGKEIKNGIKTILYPSHDLGHFVNEELKKAKESLSKARREVIKKYHIYSQENCDMVKVQDYLNLAASFLKKVYENRWNVLTFTHNVYPDANPLSFDGQSVQFPKKSDIVRYGVCLISGASISAIDVEIGTITGNIQWSDLIERGDANDKFIAHFIPREVGYDQFIVRPFHDNSLTGGYHFTLIHSFNKNLEHYIIPLVIETYKKVYKKPPKIDSNLQALMQL